MSNLCAVVDVGKTHAKLIVVDAFGNVVAEQRRANAAVATDEGYPALDTEGLGDWLCDALAGLGALRADLRRIIATTHGAAFAALKGDALALPIPDYEFAGFDDRPSDWERGLDGFDATLSPSMPRGLNAATQLDWLSRHCTQRFGEADTFVPYPQYWAWLLCGVAANEVSSLGCHTQLWQPQQRCFSRLAERAGWAARFAPIRTAWDVLGPMRVPLARRLGLRADLQVHCGVHDSNACLVRYQRAWPRTTLVSTGTWVVVMGQGAEATSLQGTQDVFANVSVQGAVVPTGRFMGGRELSTLCAGADPRLADLPTLSELLSRGVMVLPGFEAQGGPFCGSTGCIVEPSEAGERRHELADLTAPQRVTLAMLYCADVTAWLIERLQAVAPVVVEGPFASSAVFMQALAALMPSDSVHVSTDPLEGTARGAWMLAGGDGGGCTDTDPRVQAIARGPLASALQGHHARWRQRVADRVTRTN